MENATLFIVIRLEQAGQEDNGMVFYNEAHSLVEGVHDAIADTPAGITLMSTSSGSSSKKESPKKKGKCYVCGNPGHSIGDCRKTARVTPVRYAVNNTCANRTRKQLRM